MKWIYISPFFIFLIVMVVLWRGLFLHPNQIPSPLINQKVPHFVLPNLLDPENVVSSDDLRGKISILNVWASWCYACMSEHAELLEIAKDPDVTLYGLNYKDKPAEAIIWLNRNGNPYKLIAKDIKGDVAIDLGVYGTPESFIIDKKGYIRYKWVGVITANDWEKTLKPIINKLREEQ
jgi:cytochrome c biogenesis protein CcmG/thiol:disulfide interchange protein DsbE